MSATLESWTDDAAADLPSRPRSLDEDTIQMLIQQSLEVKERAYCPYSRFPVGAALLTKDGTVFTGCNVENASYGLAICAERSALVRAVSEGHQQLTAIAISCNLKTFSTPCGACRQFLAEFGWETLVIMTKPDGSYMTKTLRDMLPHGFGPSDLEDVDCSRNNYSS